MRPTVSNNIRLVTMNVPISPAERGVLNKIMVKTANMKIKINKISVNISPSIGLG